MRYVVQLSRYVRDKLAKRDSRDLFVRLIASLLFAPLVVVNDVVDQCHDIA